MFKGKLLCDYIIRYFNISTINININYSLLKKIVHADKLL